MSIGSFDDGNVITYTDANSVTLYKDENSSELVSTSLSCKVTFFENTKHAATKTASSSSVLQTVLHDSVAHERASRSYTSKPIGILRLSGHKTGHTATTAAMFGGRDTYDIARCSNTSGRATCGDCIHPLARQIISRCAYLS